MILNFVAKSIESFTKTTSKMKKTFLLIAALIMTVLISLFSWKISTITLLLTAAVISLAVFFVQDRKGKDGEQA